MSRRLAGALGTDDIRGNGPMSSGGTWAISVSDGVPAWRSGAIRRVRTGEITAASHPGPPRRIRILIRKGETYYLGG
jgi:hypothetical protein